MIYSEKCCSKAPHPKISLSIDCCASSTTYYQRINKNPENDNCDLKVEYQGGSVGNTWTESNIKESTSGITPGSAKKLTWQSQLDEGGQDAVNYKIRITPEDTDVGTSAMSSKISIDNNNIPSVSDILVSGNSGDIIVKYKLIDPP